jgi:hypothetical protein
VGLTGGIAFRLTAAPEKVLGNMSRIIPRAQDTRKLLGNKVTDANLDGSANEQSSAAHKRSKAKPGRIIMVKGQKTRRPSAWLREGSQGSYKIGYGGPFCGARWLLWA